MNVLITGAAGFLGHRLATALLSRPGLLESNGEKLDISQVRLLDVVASPPIADSRVVSVVGNLADESVLGHAVDTDTRAVFHLAAVVSGQAEADFELGMQVNLDGTRRLLDVCRSKAHAPTVVFASSVAVYGGELPDIVTDDTRLAPQSSYGTQKAIGELLVNDYSRRGFIDGRALRLPTISVRPGLPNAALSSFASGIIREPLNGHDAVCPVAPETILWLLSPATVVECLITAHNVAAEKLGANRSIILPGLAVSVLEMVEALRSAAGSDVANRVKWQRDPRVERVANTWPGTLDAWRAIALGFPTDTSFEDIVRQYMAEAGLQ